MQIAERVHKVTDRIKQACARSGRYPDQVKLVVVTKTASVEQVRQVLTLGFRDFGENRVQHLKQISSEIESFLEQNSFDESIPEKVNWHVIGHLQRNKVKQALKISSFIHSVDTLRIAEEIDASSAKLGIKTDILLQINSSGESTKYGVPVGAATHLTEQIATMRNVNLRGLMTMGPLTLDKDAVKSCFARTQEIFEEIKGEKIAGAEFTELSMGMSQDYEIAIEHGATILRIGSAIFSDSYSR